MQGGREFENAHAFLRKGTSPGKADLSRRSVGQLCPFLQQLTGSACKLNVAAKHYLTGFRVQLPCQ